MITKENYEEYFLLYIDNELSAAARADVEQFVAANPQLQEEWEALLQCRAEPDNYEVFPGKEALFHEDFLSYVDGELSEERRREVEEFVHLHPSKEIALQQLLMTVSYPDQTVCFPDKESLYRTEKRRKVLFLPWMQAGVAAAVIGVIALLLVGRRRNVPVIVKTTPNKIQPAPVTSPAPATLYSQGSDDHLAVTAKKMPQKKERRNVITEAPVKPQETAVIIRPHQADAATTNTVATDSRPVESAVITESHPAENPMIRSAVAEVNIPKEQSSFATQALQEEAEAEDTKEGVTAPAGRNKLRGIFRRVSRTFGKTADRDSDGDGKKEVLISAFQVGLK